jgi:hypothetical protein
LIHTWADGIDTSACGVDVADVMAYDLLRILGALWLEQTEANHG